jgi:LysM domain
MSAISLQSNGLQGNDFGLLRATNPSGLTRRGRLARFAVVLSLSVLLGAVFTMKAGAGSSAAHVAHSYVVVVVAPGESLWSIAADAAGRGDVRSMVDEIISVNSLAIPDVQVGQKLRVPSL